MELLSPTGAEKDNPVSRECDLQRHGVYDE